MSQIFALLSVKFKASKCGSINQMTNMRYDDITLFSVMSSKFIFYREARELYLGTSVPELHSAPSALEFYRLVVIFPLKSYL